VCLVWLVDPERRTVTVYTSAADFDVLAEDRTLDGGRTPPRSARRPRRGERTASATPGRARARTPARSRAGARASGDQAFSCPQFTPGYPVTAPSDADETCAAYLASTPVV
jgi:hypothetical protein